MPVVINGWVDNELITNPTRLITFRFNKLRKVLKEWKASLPKLSIAIEKIKLVLHFLETIEMFRDFTGGVEF